MTPKHELATTPVNSLPLQPPTAELLHRLPDPASQQEIQGALADHLLDQALREQLAGSRQRADTSSVIQLSTELLQPSPYFLVHDKEALLVDKLSAMDCDQLFVFVDEGLMSGHGKHFAEHCQDELGQRMALRTLPAGETAKNFSMLEEVCESLIADGTSKRTVLLGFGGGAACNLVGLAAGLIYRGIRYIEVPTTMTGQTDSSLSNKQGINGRSGKNHFGLYKSPEFIWSDTRYLDTEPLHLKRAGLVEAIKNGLISDVDFLYALSEQLRPDLAYSASEQHALVHQVILSKLKILRGDPTEKHYGLVLEYGHTFGHGIEWMSHLNRSPIIHGEAVAIGMQIAARLAVKLGLLTTDDVELHRHVIEDRLGLIKPIPAYVTPDGLMQAMQNDNKKTGRDLRFVLLERLGACFNPEGDYLVGVEPALAVEAIAELLADHQQRFAQ